MDEQLSKLISIANETRSRAHAPYSNFHVGAAVLTRSGNVFRGCNVENASYGLAICAERTAICSAVAASDSEIIKVVVTAHPLATPCGACRQFIFEFGQDIEVVCVNALNVEQFQVYSISDLLPAGFSFETD